MTIDLDNPELLQIRPQVATVQEFLVRGISAGRSTEELAIFAGLVLALEEFEVIEVKLSRFLTLLDHDISIDNPKPGVIRFMLSAPEEPTNE